MSINVLSSAPYFTWNGTDSRTMGIVVTEYPPYSRPKERVTTQVIPGRHGQLTMREADYPVYEQVLRTVNCYTRPGADLGAICAWLTGIGELGLGNDAGYVYDASIINQIDFRQILRGNRGYNEFAIPFQCQPFKRKATEPRITATPKNGSITLYVTNPGHVRVPAIVTVYGGNATVTIKPAGEAQAIVATINNADALDLQRGVCLNWDTGIMTHDTSDGAVLNTKVSGGPQHFNPGSNFVSITGSELTQALILENWRWL